VSIWTSLEPASTTVDPGGTATVRLRLRNTGDVVDEYRIVPVGPVAPWTTVEPPTIRLYPGTTGTVQLVFTPPRSPDATAGPNPYAVQIIPTEHPEATTVPEGNLTVTPFTEVRAELVPPTCRGRFRGRPRLAVDNLGNVRLTASITGGDNREQLSYEIHPGNVQIEPGRAAFVRTTLRPHRITWFGQKETRPFALSVLRSGAEPLAVAGNYVQQRVMPRWLLTVVSLLATLAVAFVLLWVAFQPHVQSLAQEQVAPVAATELPPPSPTAVATTAAAAPTPTASASATRAASSSGGGGGGGAPTPKASPTIVTAGQAVAALNASLGGNAGSAMGRHICYRAYVSDIGWQKPVCDSSLAGTTAATLPIEGLDLAVSGTGGVCANGYDTNTGWERSSWLCAVDGGDLYIGKPGTGSWMDGIGISVGSGTACASADLQGSGWPQNPTCTTPGHWVFFGSLSYSVRIYGLTFTV